MRATVGVILLGLAMPAWATSISHGPAGNRSEETSRPSYPPDNEAFTGTVVGVAKDQINVSNAPMAVKPGLTAITLDGKPAGLAQLKPGQSVAVVYVLDKHGRRVAHSLDAHTRPPAPTP
ncbi:MAG: hypothetical protein JST54_20280 [Deltaproteobacteria bacterium]|nr:hypothetical protein [Deltaproteobacteria bacterium]